MRQGENQQVLYDTQSCIKTSGVIYYSATQGLISKWFVTVVLSARTGSRTMSEAENVGVMESMRAAEVDKLQCLGYGCCCQCRKVFRISASIMAISVH